MRRIPIIAGPTGAGKTDLSLSLAELVDGEIVNADSRQVYRGMTVGTAKPTRAERDRIHHHLIDILDIDELFSAGEFLRRAETTISEIFNRGKLPIIVGGSTLYIYSLTHGLAKIPPVPGHFRIEIEQDGATLGFEHLYQELTAVDPKSAKTMDPTKTQRIIRALEVHRATGRPLSSFYDSPLKLPYEFEIFILNRPREQLYDRINCRVVSMIANGLIDEVATLRNGGENDSLYPLRSPGYHEVIMYLDGTISKEEMLRLIARNTRRYAKRQLTWFKRYPEKHWIDAGSASADSVNAILTDRAF